LGCGFFYGGVALQLAAEGFQQQPVASARRRLQWDARRHRAGTVSGMHQLLHDHGRHEGGHHQIAAAPRPPTQTFDIKALRLQGAEQLFHTQRRRGKSDDSRRLVV